MSHTKKACPASKAKGDEVHHFGVSLHEVRHDDNLPSRTASSAQKGLVGTVDVSDQKREQPHSRAGNRQARRTKEREREREQNCDKRGTQIPSRMLSCHTRRGRSEF